MTQFNLPANDILHVRLIQAFFNRENTNKKLSININNYHRIPCKKKKMLTSESERSLSGDESSCSFGAPNMEEENDDDIEDANSEPENEQNRPAMVVVPASELIDKVASAECLFDVAQLAFVQDPIFYQFDIHDVNRVSLDNVKVDVDGWKVSFVPSRGQGLFDFIKISQDPEVLVFRRPKPITRLLWKDSSQRGGPVRDLSGLAGVKIGRLNRSAYALSARA